MKAYFFKIWRIFFAVALVFVLWGCGDRPEPAEKEVSVRKKIVLPEDEKQKPPSTSPVLASKGPEAQTAPQNSADTTVTKKIPDVAPKPVDKTEISEPTKSASKEEDAVAESGPADLPEAISTDLTNKDDIEKGLTEKPAEKNQVPLEATDDRDVPVEPAKAAEEISRPKKPEKPEQSTATLAEDATDTVDAPDQEAAEKPADETEAPAVAESDSMDAAPDEGVSESALASILGITKESRKKKTGYDRSGKVDPFEPLFKPPKEEETPPEEEPGEEETASGKPKREKRIPRTPLEKMDLNQLKLVGIIRAESGNRALVEEASGKGYIISKGTYVGIHSGQVSEILKDRVVVEEEYEDLRGEVTTRKRELKIEKPPGEGYHEM